MKLSQRPELSVVVPLFDEEDNIQELYRRLVANLEKLRCSFELVLVNDGSRDMTGELLDDLYARDERIVVVHLSRNFGQQAAYTAGIDKARGRAVVLMDGDLQDPPEVLERLVSAWSEGYEVVYAVRARRQEGLLKRVCYATFYRMMRLAGDIDMPLDSGDFCLLDRQVVRAIRRLPENNRFLRGLRSFVGFRQIGIAYDRPAREAGTTKYDVRRLVRLALDGLIGFSGLPLTLMTWLTMAMILATTAAAASMLISSAAVNWMPVLVLATSALNLFGLSVIGEYVRRMFTETKGRPTYIVRTVRRHRSPQRVLPLRRFNLHDYLRA